MDTLNPRPENQTILKVVFNILNFEQQHSYQTKMLNLSTLTLNRFIAQPRLPFPF